MENNRKWPFRFETEDRRWVLRKTRTTIGGHKWLLVKNKVNCFRHNDKGIKYLLFYQTQRSKKKEEINIGDKMVYFLASCTLRSDRLFLSAKAANQNRELV